jgi:hypothetical protein
LCVDFKQRTVCVAWCCCLAMATALRWHMPIAATMTTLIKKRREEEEEEGKGPSQQWSAPPPSTHPALASTQSNVAVLRLHCSLTSTSMLESRSGLLWLTC